MTTRDEAEIKALDVMMENGCTDNEFLDTVSALGFHGNQIVLGWLKQLLLERRLNHFG